MVEDVDRDAVIGLLREHYARGRLDFDEFSGRVGEVLAATTTADLRHALRGLAPPTSARAQDPVAPRRPVPWIAVVLALVALLVVAPKVTGLVLVVALVSVLLLVLLVLALPVWLPLGLAVLWAARRWRERAPFS